jgi:type II secretory pathway pseudopilin PulG
MNMRRFHRPRNASGMYLIETLVALILGALLSFALLQVLAQTMRVTSTNLNKQSADLMSQTVLDSTKAMPYGAFQGTYELLPYSTSSGQVGPAVHPLTPGLDLGDLTWANSVNTNKFPGTVTLTFGPGPDANAQTAITTLTWADSGAMAGKTVSTLTVTHLRGINYWPSP